MKLYQKFKCFRNFVIKGQGVLIQYKISIEDILKLKHLDTFVVGTQGKFIALCIYRNFNLCNNPVSGLFTAYWDLANRNFLFLG